MQKRKITKAVAVTLTTAMLVQPLEQTTFAAEAITTTTNVITQYSVDTQLELQDGIGIIPESATSLIKGDNIAMRELNKPDITSDVVLAYSDEETLPLCAKRFIEYVKTEYCK